MSDINSPIVYSIIGAIMVQPIYAVYCMKMIHC